MKKLLTAILVIQLMVILTGCCCPCAKKMQDKSTAEESTPAPSDKEKPAE